MHADRDIFGLGFWLERSNDIEIIKGITRDGDEWSRVATPEEVVLWSNLCRWVKRMKLLEARIDLYNEVVSGRLDHLLPWTNQTSST